MIAAYRRTHSPSHVAWSEGRRLLGAVLHSSNEPNELSQWPCGHDDSTVNIVMGIIIIIIMKWVCGTPIFWVQVSHLALFISGRDPTRHPFGAYACCRYYWFEVCSNLPILGVPFYFCIYPLMKNYQIWRGGVVTHMGRGLFFGG